ncbi:MAG TPA: alkaline phosphatase family protein, partial [Streptosporangiaceae bacterium]|nr:alkaline phosphatase family protein [Streptosporangiaceae bacterium]
MRMVLHRRLVRAVMVIACLLVAAASVYTGARPAAAAPVAAVSSVPRLDHVFLIVEENNGLHDVIGNPAAPNLNYLAKTFGLETNYYGLSTNASEINYVGLLGGSTYGVHSDDAYWTQRVTQPSLITQLDRAGIGWKAYLQSLPYAGYQGICYPAKCNGAPDTDPLYVSKHDAIQNFTSSLTGPDWSRQVPIGSLSRDLSAGDVPRFSYVIPDECHDMHGDPPYCIDSGSIGDPQNQHLVAQGDAYLGQLISKITSAPLWARGNNAIAVTFDNGDDTKGCCDASPGGGQVATIVITSHGPRAVTDAAQANHYSLLSSIQHALGVGCLANTCDTRNVQPLAPLFAVTGSKAIATRPLPVPFYATPSPTPAEPVSETKSTPGAGGWTVQPAQLLGAADNSVGAVAGSSPRDVWAVGNFLPDAKGSNPDATLSFAEHYNGTKWTVVPTPNAGPNFNFFYGVAASQGKAWAVGQRLNSAYQDRALIEYWNGTRWSIMPTPQPGSERDLLMGASAVSPSDVWTVGIQQGADGRFGTLAEHWDGSRWSTVPTPDPGAAGNHLFAVDAVSRDNVWAVGQQLTGHAPDQGLVEHWDGRKWSVVPQPA